MNLIIFLLVAWLVYLLFFNLPARRRRDNFKNKPQKERMVQCAQCKVYLPVSESVKANGKHYCCDEHRE